MAMLRLASSTVIHHAFRAIPSQKIIFPSQQILFRSTQRLSLKCFSHDFSTDAKKRIDRRVLKAVESVIKSKQSSLNLTLPSPPPDFPFTIHDDPSARTLNMTREHDDDDDDDDDEARTLIMTRELHGEKIYVSVAMPEIILEDVDDESQFRCRCGNVAHPHVVLYVKVTKENGKILDFCVSVSAEERTLALMSVIEAAPESHDHPWIIFGPDEVYDMDSDLKSALWEYLEIRGIRKSDALFLYKYMAKKSKRDPLQLLEKFKKFVKE